MTQGYWSSVGRQRLTRRRAIAAAGGGALAAAFLAACGGGDSKADKTSNPDRSGLISAPADTAKAAKAGGTAKWYMASESGAFDIHLGGAAPLNVPRSMVYSDFISEKPGYLKPQDFTDYIADLAESWEFSPDKLQLAFKLRQNVKWHNKAPVNGRLLDMDDVLFTWKRYVPIGRYRGDLLNSANPSAPILSVTASDARTVVMKLKQPSVDLLAHLAIAYQGKPSIVPKETDSTFDIRRDMIGTGPFVLANYAPSQGYTYTRNPDYWEKDRPFVDKVEAPIVSEYAQQMAQFRAGNIYVWTTVRQEDVVSTKRDVPAVKMFQAAPTGFSPGSTVYFGWQPTNANKPFKDERVRQALSMSWDRDLFIDTFSNVSKFTEQGLPAAALWNTVMAPGAGPWRLDPKSKDFGPNAKYFQHDVAEAKKLLAAAGYASGLEVQSNYISGTQLGVDYQKQIQVLEDMAREVGFKPTAKLIDYATEYPKMRDGRGKFDGWGYVSSPPPGNDAVIIFTYRYYSKGGINFLGFDAQGKGDDSGDPSVDSQIEKARGEFDTTKRMAIVHDLQRYLAKAQYCVPQPGTAGGYTLAWPAYSNYQVVQGDKRGINYNVWIDESQAPLKKA
ncbi:MAG TPA: ABC transporter substrate-binding protein [Dehalococcoidia bacterium]|nr:ABC transporter substrate-binding protein [Dehalococcoidia bacterium]